MQTDSDCLHMCMNLYFNFDNVESKHHGTSKRLKSKVCLSEKNPWNNIHYTLHSKGLVVGRLSHDVVCLVCRGSVLLSRHNTKNTAYFYMQKLVRDVVVVLVR